jgi:4-diphosphocytidyl-2-C-methyl-D-erythritol kinase
MQIKSYAKINLGLRIVGKRSDGYHDIETIFYPISLFDEITLYPTPAISLTCTDPAIPVNSDNLCWKAAELFLSTFGIFGGVSIAITKRIPSGAGLGGGSSNAGATLLAMCDMFNVNATDTKLKEIALQIGSDVPFFLRRGVAFGEGRGERLTYIRYTLPYWIVLVNPGIHVSTPWAYAAYSEHGEGKFPNRKKLQELFSSTADIPILHNDFEDVVFAKYPEIASIKRTVLELGAMHAMMSGSGSSVFGLFENESGAKRASEYFSGTHFTHCTPPYFSSEHV